LLGQYYVDATQILLDIILEACRPHVTVIPSSFAPALTRLPALDHLTSSLFSFTFTVLRFVAFLIFVNETSFCPHRNVIAFFLYLFREPPRSFLLCVLIIIIIIIVKITVESSSSSP
jgi:hypothetical protein